MTTLITEKDKYKYKSLETEIEKQDALKRVALLENRLNAHIAEMNNRLIVLENKVNTTNHKNDEIFIYDNGIVKKILDLQIKDMVLRCH